MEWLWPHGRSGRPAGRRSRLKAGGPGRARPRTNIRKPWHPGINVRSTARSRPLRLTLSNRIVVVRHIANALVLLGLIGTVIGFIISLSGVDPTAASDANKVGAMVATLISGMSVALNTTLVGSILYVWLIVNHRILATGTVRLLTTVLHMPGTDADAVSHRRPARSGGLGQGEQRLTDTCHGRT